MNEKTKILFLYNHTDFKAVYRSSYKTLIEFKYLAEIYEIKNGS